MDDLVQRLRSHISMMAPHHRDREAGRLLIDSLAGIERLHRLMEMRNRYVSDLETEIGRLQAQLAARDRDAERWRKLPAFLEAAMALDSP
jgi:hypothetical protein